MHDSEHELSRDPSGGVAEPEQTVERPTRAGPRIYVASLRDYNAGRLHGVWRQADQEVEELERRQGAPIGPASVLPPTRAALPRGPHPSPRPANAKVAYSGTKFPVLGPSACAGDLSHSGQGRRPIV